MAHQKVSWQAKGRSRSQVLAFGIWEQEEEGWEPMEWAASLQPQSEWESLTIRWSSSRAPAQCSGCSHCQAFSFLSLHFPTPWENKVGMKACTHLITSPNYQLNNTWTRTRHADGWLPLLILFYFYCLARASSFKSWIIRTETLRYFSQINPWPIDTLLYLTKHTTLLFPDNFSINCFSALIRYKVRLWLGLYIPISDKLSWSPNQLRLGF